MFHHQMFNGIITAGGGGCAAVLGSNATYGTGTRNETTLPFYGLYNYSESATIILQSEIGSGEKQINKLGIYFESFSGSYNVNNQEVWIAHVTESVFDSTPEVGYADMTISDLTQCHSGFSFTFSGAGTYIITFENNFCYNGVDNLLVIWKNKDGTWASGYGNTHSTDQGIGVFRQAVDYRDANYPVDGQQMLESRYRMNIRLDF